MENYSLFTKVLILLFVSDLVLLVRLVDPYHQVYQIILHLRGPSFQKNVIFISKTEVSCTSKYVINCTLDGEIDNKTNEYSISGSAMYAESLNSFYVSGFLFEFKALLIQFDLTVQFIV